MSQEDRGENSQERPVVIAKAAEQETGFFETLVLSLIGLTAALIAIGHGLNVL